MALETAAVIPGLPVDLRPLGAATPRFRANVLRDGMLLYESDRELRLQAEARIMVERADFQPTWTMMRKRMFERWTHG
jgi:hypothetical protein